MSLHRFHVLEDAVAVLVCRGVYRQAKLYRRGGGLYAAYGAGFLRLYSNYGTSVPNVRWDSYEVEGAVTADSFGRLSLVQP